MSFYFDYNATTPVHSSCIEAMDECLRHQNANPSSIHQQGCLSRKNIEAVRSLVASTIGSSVENVIFTSGATEGIQVAVLSALCDLRSRDTKRNWKVAFGATEHKAVPQALEHWLKVLQLPFELVELSVDSSGQINPGQIKALGEDLGFLCTMAVNNETGVIQDLDQVSKDLPAHTLWLVDCVQAFGKIPLQFESNSSSSFHSRINYAVMSAHKYYGPKGLGLFYLKKNTPFTSLVTGGGQERGLRSGTENLPAILGFGAVIGEFLPEIRGEKTKRYELAMRNRSELISTLEDCFPTIQWNTPLDHSVPFTLNFSVPGISSKELLNHFDAAGLQMSAASACSAKNASPSYVLKAMGFSDERCWSAIRLSFGYLTEAQEVDQACQRLRICASILGQTGGTKPSLECEFDRKKTTAQNSNCLHIKAFDLNEDQVSWLLWTDNSPKSYWVSSHSSKNSELHGWLKKEDKPAPIELDPNHALPEKLQTCVVRLPWGETAPAYVPNPETGKALVALPLSQSFCLVFGRVHWSSASGVAQLQELEIFFCRDEESVEQVRDLQKKVTASDSQNWLVATNFSSSVSSYLFCLKTEAQAAGYSNGISLRTAKDKYSSARWVDVREETEQEVFYRYHSLEGLGLSSQPQCVPLSRLAEFAKQELKRNEDGAYIFLCRTGNRAKVAAESLREIGFPQAYWLQGGVVSMLPSLFDV